MRANLAQASSLIRDWSLLSQGLTAGVSNAFRIVSTVAIRGLQISLTGLAGTFAITAKAGAEFQDEIVRAFVIMKEGGNAASGALSQLTEKALQLGRDTLFSATDAAEGMQILARAGFNTREVLDSIGPALAMAINGELELAESSEILISAIRGFNLNAKESKKVADVMTMGANAASTSLGELGEAFSYVAPIAMAAGLSIEEVTAAIGLLSDSGIKGSMAGTSLRRILSELLAPTGKAKDIFKDANLTFTDSSGRLKHLTAIVRDLQKANLTAGQVFEAFGDRAASGVAALIIRGSPALMELQTQLENSQGAAERMSQAFRTTVIGRVRDLFASLKNLGLGFSQQFNEPLAKAIYAVRNFIVDITDISNRMGLFKAIVNGVQKVMAPVIQWIKEWSIGFKKWLSELTPQKVTTFFDNIAIKVAAVVKSLKEGELKKIFEEIFKAVILAGEAIIGTIQGISKAFLAMPDWLKNIVRPMTVWSSLILYLLGGFMNILIFIIAIKAVFVPIIAGAGKLILLFKYGWIVIAGIQIILAAIAGILVGLTIDKLLGEFLRFRQIAATVLLLFGAIGPTLKLAAMGMLAFSQPWMLLNKDFRDEMAKTAEEISLKINAIKELDWLNKNKVKSEAASIVAVVGNIGEEIKTNLNKSLGGAGETISKEVGKATTTKEIVQKKPYMEVDGKPLTEEELWKGALTNEEAEKEVQWPVRGSGFLEIGGRRIDLETIKANEEIEAIKKMIRQSERIGGVLGPSIRTSLLVGLQERLDELEKIVMNQEGDLAALNRQTIKPEADRKNKARIGAGLE